MHLISVQNTLTLLEVAEEVFTCGEAVGAAAEQTISIIIVISMNGHTSCLCSELYNWCQSNIISTW